MKKKKAFAQKLPKIGDTYLMTNLPKSKNKAHNCVPNKAQI